MISGLSRRDDGIISSSVICSSSGSSWLSGITIVSSYIKIRHTYGYNPDELLLRSKGENSIRRPTYWFNQPQWFHETSGSVKIFTFPTQSLLSNSPCQHIPTGKNCLVKLVKLGVVCPWATNQGWVVPTFYKRTYLHFITNVIPLRMWNAVHLYSKNNNSLSFL
mgnify:CR=1 FL=1